MLIVLCWGYDHKAGNKININSFIGPYLKYFSRDKRIALAALGQYFLSREKYFYVRTDKRVNIIIVLNAPSSLEKKYRVHLGEIKLHFITV